VAQGKALPAESSDGWDTFDIEIATYPVASASRPNLEQTAAAPAPHLPSRESERL
jgi:starvation-inducible outer membrane lipoprotein